MTRRGESLDDFLKRLEDPPQKPAESRARVAPPPPPPAHRTYVADPLAPRDPTRCCLCPRRAKHLCVSCGNPTCSEHHWALMGLCHECATEEEMKQGRSAGKYGLGIKWVE